MSYFYGAPVTNFDNCHEKRSGRKHNKHRSLAPDGTDLEPVHRSRHRHKHVSRSRHAPKLKLSPNDTQDMNPENENASTSKSRSKRHLQKDIQRLLEENEKLASRLESSAGDSGIQQSTAKDLRDKEALIIKLQNKNEKMQIACKDINTENIKLKELLNQRETDYRKLHIHHEELTQFAQGIEEEKNHLLIVTQKLKADKLQLTEDLGLLKNLIYKLNVEIERYQDKLRQEDRNGLQQIDTGTACEVDTTNDTNKMLESWGRVNIHALGPLLDAYQENLSEKDDLIKKYGKEIEEFSGRCKDIVAENEMLHKEIKDLVSKLKSKTEEIEELTRDATVVKEQNDLLIKQVSLLKQKLVEIHAVYEKKVESMSRDNEKIHNDFLACKSELSNIQGKYEILNEGYEKLKHNNERTMPVSVHMAAIDECKHLFEELKSQYELEKQKLLNKIKYLEETQPENERQLIMVTAERDQLKTTVKCLEKNLKRTQHKLEHLQNSIYSIQVSRDSLKRQLNKTAGYCEELAAEQERLVKENRELSVVLQEREKENENYQYLGDSIVNRMGNLKNQIKSVQAGAKEQLKTVEKHIKSQEIGADQMKTEYQRELERLKQLLRQKEDLIGKLQREKYATQDNLELVWRAATSGDKKVKDVLKNTKIYNI
ncbi:centrosomal protein of 89 kDa isoform X1 [Neodiprion fabricii]|uniref:centrosomal protein of 89 kDa isoform X1 n=2 Tax=Neodiprion fabricii TaxID=2872261 RepID=UPI001ED9178B|nr:centrosomal protein of 89 kDa isoform X1 [Neodiprion fabricii]